MQWKKKKKKQIAKRGRGLTCIWSWPALVHADYCEKLLVFCFLVGAVFSPVPTGVWAQVSSHDT